MSDVNPPEQLGVRTDSHDGLEVVVHQYHVGRLLADISARLAHRHANVSGLQGHGVIHPVARHGHHSADVLEGLKSQESDLLYLGSIYPHHLILQPQMTLFNHLTIEP